MRTNICRLPAFLLMAILSMAGSGGADVLNNNEVQFTGAVKSVVVNGEGEGTLFIALDTIDLRVIVNPRTVIQNLAGGLISIDDLETLAQQALSASPPAELLVEVTGKFSSSGILSTRMHVVDMPADFNLRGHITRITQLSADRAYFSLLGISILADLTADPPTRIQSDGAEIPLSELKIGTKITAMGSIQDDGTWLASHIEVLTSKKKGMVYFEGTVEAYVQGAGGYIDVAVNGASSNITRVWIVPSTKIQGTLSEHVEVLVIGTINPQDYSFTAREIRVLAGIEIKPDKSKLKLGADPRTLTVKLREAPAADVTVHLSVDPAGIVSLSADSVVIPAGSKTADFTVSPLAVGTATVKASANGQEATALVMVSEVESDDDDPPAEGQVRIYFSPDHLKLRPNDSREVVLHIHPPQKSIVEVSYTSSDESVVPLPTARVLSNGAAMFKVLITSTEKTGRGISVVATLPGALGGGKAELLVDVEDKKPK